MIYLIENPAQGICKIGVSVNPDVRLATLQTATPDPLRLRATLPGSFAEEKVLHDRFAAARLGGEWFDMTDEIMAHFGVQHDFFISDKFALTMLRLDGATLKVALWLGLHAGYNTNRFTATKELKTRLATETGVASVENALTALVKHGHLRRSGRAEYMIGPDTTWRGDLKSRAKSIQVFLNYTVEQP